MAPNLFSLTNLLLATSFLFALTNGAPIPKALDPDRDSAFLPTRDMWSEVAAVRPRYSAIDNLRFSSPAENPRVVPRSPKWVEATFDPKEPVQSEKLSKRAPFAPHFRIGTVMRPDEEFRTPILPRTDRGPGSTVLETDANSLPHARIGVVVEDRKSDGSEVSGGDPEDGDVLSKKSDVRTKVGARNSGIETSLFGPTETYSGSLWRRSLKRDLLP